MPIRTLPALLVNQIAAGEVIERPASVVKELVENSLDAGATRVDVAVEQGGNQLIRVSDNGHGIPGDELPLAVTPHATSKLATVQQLAGIATLGFRGEALASIAAVSRLRLVSRATIDGRTAEEGRVLEASGDQISAAAPAASAAGTVVEVRDLFFNTPARRKYRRSAATEFGHISDVMGRIAIAWPRASITLSHNGRTALELVADDSPRRRFLNLIGADLDDAMIEFEQIQGDVRVWGLAAVPSMSRSTGKFQYVTVNRRPVRDRNLAHAVREAFRGLMPPDRHPLCLLMLELAGEGVDVNVHPTKAEVRFAEPGRIHAMVLNTIRKRLLGADLTPTAALRPTSTGAGDLADMDRPSTADAAPAARDAGWRGSGAATGTYADPPRQTDRGPRGFDYDQMRRVMAEQPEGVAEPGPTEPALHSHVVASSGVLQIHKCYLVTQDEQGILIVDQHALHERVMFEQLRDRLRRSDLESQRLLMPSPLKTDAKRLAALESLRPLLKRIGIDAEPSGPAILAIHAFPSFLFERNVDPAQFVEELLDKAEDGQFDTDGEHAEEAALHSILDMMACKAAVKAGDDLKPQELCELLSQRDRIERSSACPHGRPTTIRLTLQDLEKQFGRR